MSAITLLIATSLDDLSPVQISPEALFGRHCAIIGSSGGGKSWSLARVVEQASEHRAKILLFDASGEFERLGGATFHIHVGEATRDDCASNAATIPYFELSENDLIAILQPSDAIQWIKLRAAIRTLKLLHLCPSLASAGNFAKSHKPKGEYERAITLHSKQLDRPYSIFNIHKLPLQIDLECVEPVRSHSESDSWGATCVTEQATCVPLVNRLVDLLRTPELRCLFNPPPHPSAFEAVEKFITDRNVSVLRISLEFLPMTHNIRSIVADSLARHLLNMARASALSECPVIIALDEAHQVLRERADQDNRVLPPSGFELIAKEGRKYGLTLCLATQRPGDIPESLLSQVGTLIVHRLVSTNDQKAVDMAAGGLSDKAISTLATLGAGEALILGVGVREPRRVKMLAPKELPRSFGPNYQMAWRKTEA